MWRGEGGCVYAVFGGVKGGVCVCSVWRGEGWGVCAVCGGMKGGVCIVYAVCRGVKGGGVCMQCVEG